MTPQSTPHFFVSRTPLPPKFTYAPSMPGLEIAIFDSSAALTVLEGGAERIELCAGPYESGGLTPRPEDVAAVRAAIAAVGSPAHMHCMLRPRAGNFVYSAMEIEQMEHDLKCLAAAGAQGVVFGILKSERSDGSVAAEDKAMLEQRTKWRINAPCCTSLCREAHRLGLRTIFHRAFDHIEDWHGAINDLATCGFDSVLTAGSDGPAVDLTRLLETVPAAREKGIEVIVGGGVRSWNISSLIEQLDVDWWHSSAMSGPDVSMEEVRQLQQNIQASSVKAHR